MLGSASMRPQIDTIRKRAGILYRKKLHAGTLATDQGRTETQNVDTEVERPRKRRKTDDSDVDHLSPEERMQEDDITVLAKFLMSRQAQVQDDEQDEAAFWALISSQVCPSFVTFVIHVS